MSGTYPLGVGMSDVIPGDDEFWTPERRAQPWKWLAQVIPTFAAGRALGMVTSDPQAETLAGKIPIGIQSLASFIPNVASGMYGLGSEAVKRNTGLDMGQLPLPAFVERINEHVQRGEDKLISQGYADWLGPAPKDDFERASRRSAFSAGIDSPGLEFAPFLGGLGRGAKAALGIAAPAAVFPGSTTALGAVGSPLIDEAAVEYLTKPQPEVEKTETGAGMIAQADQPKVNQITVAQNTTQRQPRAVDYMPLTFDKDGFAVADIDPTKAKEPRLSFELGKVGDFDYQGGGTSETPLWVYAAGYAGLIGAVAIARNARNIARRSAEVMEAARGKQRAGMSPENAAIESFYQPNNNLVNSDEVPQIGSHPVNQLENRAENSLWNSNAQLEALAKVSQENPRDAARLAADAGLSADARTMHARIREQVLTGRDMAGNRVPRTEEFYRAYGSLTDDQRELLNAGAAASNELNNRAELGRLKGVAQADPAARYGLHTQDTATLVAERAAMLADPEARRVWDMYRAAIRGHLENARDNWGFVTPQDYQRVSRVHPDYVPTYDTEGRLVHTFGPRELETNAGPMARGSTELHELLAQKEYALYRDMAHNSIVKQIVDGHMARQAADPNFPKLFVEVAEKNRGPDPVIAVRTSDGVKYYMVHDKHAFHVLDRFSGLAPLATNYFSKLSHLYTQATTGPLAAVGGSLFAPVNAVRGALSSGIEAPRGSYRGVADLAMRKATGERIGIPGVDAVLNPATMLAYAPYDLGMQTIAGVSRMLDPANTNWFNRALRAHISNQGVDKLRNTLNQLWQRSAPGAYRAAGLGGQGARVRTALETARPLDTKLALPQMQAVPDAFRPTSRLGRPASFTVDLWRMFNDANNWISDLPHRTHFALNRTNPRLSASENEFNALRLTGIPGLSGGSKLAQWVGQNAPYFNPSVQGLRTTMRSMGENPIAWLAGVPFALGSLSLLEHFAWMVMGQDHVDYYMNTLTPEQRMRDIKIPYDPTDPSKSWSLPLPQQFMPIKALTSEITGRILQLEAAAHDENHWYGQLDLLSELFDTHVSRDTRAGVYSGIKAALPLTSPGPAIDVPLAFAGVRYDPQNFDLMSTPKAVELAGQAPDDSLFGNAERSATLRNVLNAGLGVVGQSMFEMMREGQKAPDILSGLQYAGDAWTQQARDINRLGSGTVFENQLRSSVSTTRHKDFAEFRDAMTKIEQVNARSTGMTRRGGEEIVVLDPSRLPRDPTMAQMYRTYVNLGRFLDRRGGEMDQWRDVRKQLGTLDRQNLQLPDKRTMYNDLVDKQLEIERKIMDHARDTNAMISRQLGATVDVKDIDWSKGPEQFNRLVP